jgi:hypothetical protein
MLNKCVVALSSIEVVIPCMLINSLAIYKDKQDVFMSPRVSNSIDSHAYTKAFEK